MLICLGLVGLRLSRPDLTVDDTSLWLIAIAAFLFVAPELKTVLPYIKRVRIGNTELELVQQIADLGKEVVKAQEAIAARPGVVAPSAVSSEVEEIYRRTSQDPRAALLLLSAELEQRVRSRLQNAGVERSGRLMSLPQAVEAGVRADILPREVLPPFRDFWAVRNRVAHGDALEVDNSIIYSLVSVGAELLKMVSVEQREQPASS